MKKAFFECTRCGKCCGPIPITSAERFRIRRAIRRLPQDEILRLKNHEREALQCVLYDVENRKCSVYDVRPEICKMHGLFIGMECPNNKGFATGTRSEGAARIRQAHQGEEAIGVLSMDYTWENGLL